ncbi:DNA polymerase eta [Camellia lanceoleosa]|uniref:DNA polymerase eta n=1 Tax=Camellia lanceoleosa TaxID=1840588 RepID=A0ACC0I372_9ERIC|nr:DNA polymerase eta [Camellia lanceoleosa]
MVEQRKQPHLRGQPTAVVQYNSWKGGGLIAVSYEARKYGVKCSMRGDEAKQVCPQIELVQVPVARGKADLSIYQNAGLEVVSILARNGRCERASIDEVYLDLTDAAEAMLAETPPESLGKIDEEALKSHILSLNEGKSTEMQDRMFDKEILLNSAILILVLDHKDNVKEWLHRSDADHLDKLLACGALIVAELRMQVLKETEFTCSAGITHNKDTCETMQSTDDQLSHREFRKEEIRIKNLMHGMRPHDHKGKMVKDKGSFPILRFFQSCNNSSSSPKQEHVRTIDETKASSSSSFQSVIGNSELIEAELRKENLLTHMGTQWHVNFRSR